MAGTSTNHTGAIRVFGADLRGFGAMCVANFFPLKTTRSLPLAKKDADKTRIQV